MDIFRVSFIGHRVVDEYRQVEEELDEVIELLHRKYGFIDFNVGRNGEFDELATQAVRRFRREWEEWCELTLVEPYPVANLDIIEKSYDSVIIPTDRKCHYKAAITVARSRGIRFLFVLQSYSQLTAKYGRDVGDIIKTNCNVKIFIGSDDSETRKEFSELCGQKKIKQFSVNTNAENPASSNTGATLQPLISVGMLERLNGDEKGDAIVSVRGYEPIWTVFTPSYELKKVYFPEGKAAIGKREAVLFEKENYVFDITGDIGQKIEDKLSELIEEQEAEEARADENDKAKRVAKLTEQWDDVEAELQRVVDNICVYLDGKDEKAVRQAAYEHKVRLLLGITEHYNRSIANEIRVAADKIQLELLPRMKEYQEQATK